MAKPVIQKIGGPLSSQIVVVNGVEMLQITKGKDHIAFNTSDIPKVVRVQIRALAAVKDE